MVPVGTLNSLNNSKYKQRHCYMQSMQKVVDSLKKLEKQEGDVSPTVLTPAS